MGCLFEESHYFLFLGVCKIFLSKECVWQMKGLSFFLVKQRINPCRHLIWNLASITHTKARKQQIRGCLLLSNRQLYSEERSVVISDALAGHLHQVQVRARDGVNSESQWSEWSPLLLVRPWEGQKETLLQHVLKQTDVDWSLPYGIDTIRSH